MGYAEARKKLFTFCMLVAIFAPVSASAQKYFGGTQEFIFDEGICDCSGSNVHFIEDDGTHELLTLDYNGSARLYDNEDIDGENVLELGSYSPGGEPCMQEDGPDCVELETVDGTYSSDPGVGTAMSMLEGTRSFFATALNPFVKNFLG